MSIAGLSPAPFARNRSDGSIPASTSACALITVLRDIPDAAATADFPPGPNARAIDPATTRRCTSFKCGITVAKKSPNSSGSPARRHPSGPSLK